MGDMHAEISMRHGGSMHSLIQLSIGGCCRSLGRTTTLDYRPQSSRPRPRTFASLRLNGSIAVVAVAELHYLS